MREWVTGVVSYSEQSAREESWKSHKSKQEKE